MNSSAKITVATLLAASALGVAVISACTVTSTTTPDTDGGASTSSSGSTGSTGTSSGASSSGSTSGGTSSGAVACTTSKQDAGVKFRNDACQKCLESKCCTQLTNCFNKPETLTNIDCNDYHNCIEGADGDSTKESLCDDVAGDAGIVEAYDEVATCGNTNCKTECGQ